ncbi:hypothetical protein JMUB6875_01690 [Nocardia sp. JMUB6875]
MRTTRFSAFPYWCGPSTIRPVDSVMASLWRIGGAAPAGFGDKTPHRNPATFGHIGQSLAPKRPLSLTSN